MMRNEILNFGGRDEGLIATIGSYSASCSSWLMKCCCTTPGVETFVNEVRCNPFTSQIRRIRNALLPAFEGALSGISRNEEIRLL